MKALELLTFCLKDCLSFSAKPGYNSVIKILLVFAKMFGHTLKTNLEPPLGSCNC